MALRWRLAVFLVITNSSTKKLIFVYGCLNSISSKSFEYIDADKSLLINEVKPLHVEQFTYFKSSNIRSNIYHIDKHLKSIGFMISANERELLKTHKTLIVARKFVINQNEDYVFIVPYIRDTTMSKEFKELMRSLHVEPKLRAYFYENTRSFEILKGLISSI